MTVTALKQSPKQVIPSEFRGFFSIFFKIYFKFIISEYIANDYENIKCNQSRTVF